jgi:hypothetical protein
MGSMTGIMSALGTVGTVARYVTPLLSAGQKASSSNQDYKHAQQDAVLKRQQNLLSYQKAETDRLAKLRQSVAAHRAVFGGRGIGVVAGSSEAVLDNLTSNSDIKRQQNKADYDLTESSIAQSLGQMRQANLLEKQQLKQSALLSRVGDIF